MSRRHEHVKRTLLFASPPIIRLRIPTASTTLLMRSFQTGRNTPSKRICRSAPRKDCSGMIVVKKINGQEIVVNCELIETIEFTPHAVLSLTTGEKLIVDETRDELLKKIVNYKRAIHQRPESMLWT